MNPQDFDRLRALVLSLTELPPAARHRELERVHQQDPELAQAAATLLKYDRTSPATPGHARSTVGGPVDAPPAAPAGTRFDDDPPRAEEGPSMPSFLPREEQQLLLRLWNLVAAPSPDQSVSSAAPQASRRPPLLAVGDQLAGRYRVEQFLDRGGMGEVHRALDELLDTPVALKIVRPEIAQDPAALRSFKQEVLLARSISHPNVCRIFDLGWDETRQLAYLTMEFLPGETLRSRIVSQGPLAPEDSLELIRQLADGLDAAHRAGVIHRDFKSVNVMLVPDPDGDVERAVIMDFGLAVEVRPAAPHDGPAPPRGIAGTPAYMSPEQVTGRPLTPASDLYALGVVLFEMVTARLPFRHDTPLQMALAHLEDPVPLLPEFTALKSGWRHTILRLLSKDPADRYACAAEVVHALEGRATTGESAATTLPAERDAFIGREDELEALARAFDISTDPASTPDRTARLITLLGPGGTGKTRLSLRYGWSTLAQWPGGVWFCDLSDARSVEGIAQATASGLNVHLGKQDPIVQLGHAIAGRGRALIVLDNFEQVAPHAEASLGHWLTRASDARFLVTSRERLHLPEETLHELEPLDPATRGVELFEVRARGHRVGFRLDPSNRRQAEQIVQRLDGLPLAIELAAARLRTLGLEQLRARLEDRFRILTGGQRGRHETLAATLDWSWELLLPWERAAIEQASCFDGGFDLEAAEAVIDLTEHPKAPPLLDVIQSLVDKSWVRTKVVRGAPRFEMYVTVRDYTSSKLNAQPETAAHGAHRPGSRQAVRDRHGRYFAEMGTEESLEVLSRHGGGPAHAALHLELANLLAACRAATGDGNQDVAAATYLAAAAALEVRGPLHLSIELGAEVLPAVVAPALRTRVLLSLAFAEHFAGRNEDARAHFEEALALSRELGDRRSEGVVLGKLGNLDREQGRVEEARDHLESALRIDREVGDRHREGIDIGNLGVLHLEQGRLDLAREHYDAALAIHREVGNRRLEGNVLNNLAILDYTQGRIDDAARNYEAALATQRAVGNRRSEGNLLGNLGILHFERGQLKEAGEHYEAALLINREVGERLGEGVVLSNLGTFHYEQGNTAEARTLLEAALGIHRELRNRRSEGVVLSNLGLICVEERLWDRATEHYAGAVEIFRDMGYQRGLGQVLGAMGSLHTAQEQFDDAARCFAEGLAILRDVDQLELGKVLCEFGRFQLRRDDPEAARAALHEARAIAQKHHLGPGSEVTRAIEKLAQELEPPPS